MVVGLVPPFVVAGLPDGGLGGAGSLSRGGPPLQIIDRCRLGVCRCQVGLAASSLLQVAFIYLFIIEVYPYYVV